MALKHNHFEHLGIYLSERFTVCMSVCERIYLNFSLDF